MTGITNPTEEYFKDGLWGWDGTQWRKLGIIFGYNSTVEGVTTAVSGGSGGDVLESSTVPSGELWILNNVGVIDQNHVPTRITIYLVRSGEVYPLVSTASISANIWTVWHGKIVMKSGDKVTVYFGGATLDDALKITWLGYKVSLT